MKAAIYLRISSDPTGQELGVSRQREDCLKLCQAKGWTPVEYVDNDVSASSGRARPAYEAMLSDARDGVIGAVVAWDLDRLHRRPVELEQFMALADEKHLALATASGDVDLSTAQGRLVARMKGSVAAHEIEHKRARQLRAAEQKAQRGEPKWKYAFGYLGDTHKPDPVTAPLVQEAYASVLAGGSITDTAKKWNAADRFGLTGRPWTPSTVSLFLRSPRNAGLREHRGEIVGNGTWPALVDESTWRAAQSVLNAPGRSRRKTVRRHLLTRMLKCGKDGCGGDLSGYQNINKIIYYRCKACFGVAVRADHVEPLVFGMVAERLAQPDAVDLLKSSALDETEAQALRTERMALLARLDEIADERADGLLTGQQAQRATGRIQEKLAVIDARERDAEKLRVFADLPLGSDEVADKLTSLSADRFRAVLDALAEVTVRPVGKGARSKDGERFDPDRVVFDWR